ncbi:hypothetical protein NECID01_0057 [Nematocida sp. AWRm77]|nr:hypothetical protein NECID01_0057 [Nematocida sp. AWRm77]
MYNLIQYQLIITSILYIHTVNCICLHLHNADRILAGALQTYHKLKLLALAANKYSPGFLACHLQTLLSRLVFLNIYKILGSNKYSKEDYKAEKEGCRIRIITQY